MWLGIGNFLLADLTQMAFIPTMSRLFATASTAASYLGKIQNAFWGDHKITHSVIINGIIMTFFNYDHIHHYYYISLLLLQIGKTTLNPAPSNKFYLLTSIDNFGAIFV